MRARRGAGLTTRDDDAAFERVVDLLGLHQLYPVAVHALLFGGGYVGRTRALLHATSAG